MGAEGNPSINRGDHGVCFRSVFSQIVNTGRPSPECSFIAAVQSLSHATALWLGRGGAYQDARWYCVTPGD